MRTPASSPFLPALAAALLLSAAAHAAPNDTALDRVEVQGNALRTDVLRSCPAVQVDLHEALARSLYRHQIEGSYRVSFELDRQGVLGVDSSGAPRQYRQAIREGLRRTACSSSHQTTANSQAAQRFAFLLDVRNESRGRDSTLPARPTELALLVGVRALP